MAGLALKLRKMHFWELLSVVLLVLLVFSYYKGFDLNVKSKEEVGEEVVDFINTNIFRGQVKADLVDITEEYGLYSVKLDVSGEELNSYATKDGKILFPQAIDLEEVIPITPSQSGAAVSCDDYTKKDKPVIDLFVMSMCPFGTIAEQVIAPVLDLLGDKIEFNLYFIANENEDGSFKSLHGQPEVDENIRQICIAETYSRDILMDYLLCVAEDYRNVGTIWEECANDNEIVVDEIKECAEGDEGKELFSENIKIGNERGVGGSPTLMINGDRYSGARTSDGYKEGICCGFNIEPDECEETLSGDSNPASGSC